MVQSKINIPKKIEAKSRRWKILSKSWRFLFIVILCLGFFFRFANLDSKVYWLDEVKASYKISGYKLIEYEQKFNNQIITAEDFRKYLDPKPESTIGDTIGILTQEDSKHVPLYFVMLRFWVNSFGNSIATIRSLSAVISLLAIPSMYLLCLELFDSSLAGTIGAMLIAISPFFVLYAQEARPYSLWTVIILLSSYFLLKTIRLQSKLNLGLYTLSLILAIYTHTLSILVIISHGVYVLCTQIFRSHRMAIAYLISTLICLISFYPWFQFILKNQEELSNSIEWHSITIPFYALINWWIINLNRLFFDIDSTYSIETNFASFNNGISISIILISLVIVSYSIYYLIWDANSQIKWFILSIITIPTLALTLPDVFSGGIRSTAARYFHPSYIGIYLSVTYLLSRKINYDFQPSKLRMRKFWIFITLLLIASGIFSCDFISSKTTWWNKYMNSELPEIAKVINRADKPLIVIDSYSWSRDNALSLSHLLDSQVKLQLLSDKKSSSTSRKFQNIFLFIPSEQLLNSIEQKSEIQLKQINPEAFFVNTLFEVSRSPIMTKD